MNEKLRLEIFIARPPTRKCRKLIAVMEEVVRRHPDEARLLIFERGVPWQEEPCAALKTNVNKGGGGVPLSFVGGQFLVGGKVPTVEEVEGKIAEVLRERARWGKATK
jgi:hypothetical protein